MPTQREYGGTCWINMQQTNRYIRGAIQGILFELRRHLHLFTTAVVYLTTSAINFDPANSDAGVEWRVCAKPQSTQCEYDCFVPLFFKDECRKRHTQTVVNPIMEGWNLLKILNGRGGESNKKKEKKSERWREPVNERENETQGDSEGTSALKFHTLQSLIEKLQ